MRVKVQKVESLYSRICLNKKAGLENWLSLFFILGLTLGAALFSLPFTSGKLLANPEGGAVVAGSATITQDGQSMQIHQSSDKAVIDWSTFNIKPQEKTEFHQPSAQSITLNRVDPRNGSSNIQGYLTANGHVWILNPAGVLIGSTARIDVGGLLVSTAGISKEDFMAGHYHFVQDPNWHGAVINEGQITVADRGLVALVAPGVENRGVIRAHLGKVALAAGNEYTVDLYGDQLIQFGLNSQVTQPAVDPDGKPLKNGVSNRGKIIADGGTVLITANTAKNIVDNAINMSGYVRANSAVERNGEIILMAAGQGAVRVTGKLIASGRHRGQKGGTVKVLAEQVKLTHKAKIDVSGDSGGGQVLIGGNAHGAGPEPNAQTTYVGPQVRILADALTQGDGGKVVLWSQEVTDFYGSISARGGFLGGNGGWVETSGLHGLNFNGQVDASAPLGSAGTLLLDPMFLIVATGGAAYSNGSNNLYANNSAGTTTIDPTSIASVNANVILQANSDVIITNGWTNTNAGRTLTINAGRSVLINDNIATTNGAITITANDSGATSADRATTSSGNPPGDTETTNGNITIASGKTITSGTGGITLAMGSSTTSPFTPGSIGSSATPIATVSTGTLTLTANSGGAYVSNTGSMTLAAPTLSVADVPLSVISSGTLTLPASAINTGAGDLTLKSNGGTLATAGNLTTTSGNLTLVGSTGLTLGNALQTGSGNLSLSNTASGNITQNAGGTITSTSGNLVISSLNTLTLAAATNVGSGTLSLSANTDGAGAQGLTMNAGSSLTTTNTSASAATISVNTSGGGTGAAALRSITTGSGGTLAISSNGGNITQTAATLLNVGTGTINLSTNQTAGLGIGSAGANILAQAASLAATAGSSGIFINNSGTSALTLGTINTTGSFSLNSTSSGGLAQSSNIAVTGTTTLVAGSGQNVILTASTNDFGTVTVTSGNNVSLQDTNSLILGTSTISGNLNVTTGGALTQSGAITNNGGNTATFAAGSANNITLNTAGNDFSTVAVTSGNTVSLRDANSLILGTSTVSGNLTVQTAGALTQSGALSVNGAGATSTFIAGAANDITLSNSANDFTNLVITSGNNVTLQDANALNFGAATSTISGNLNVTTNGAITQSGTLTNSTAGRTATFSAGSSNDVTLNSATNNFATVSVTSANNATFQDSSAFILGTTSINGTLTLTTGGAITQSGALTAPTLIVKTLNNGGSAITLGNAGNTPASIDLRVRNAADTGNANGPISYTGVAGFDVAAANTTGTVSLTAGGAITQSGSITGTTLTLNTPGDITLNNPANAFTTMTITSGDDVILQDADAIALGTSTITGNLTLTAGGAITQSGAVTNNGAGVTATFAAGSTNNITLNNAGNDFSTVAITSGNTVSLRDANSLILGTSAISGNLTVQTAGALTQSGALTVNGAGATTTLTAGTANDITLDNTSNDFTNLVISSGNDVTLQDANALNFGAATSTVSGNLSVMTNGAITQSGALNVSVAGKTASFSAGSANDITLSTATNNFATVAVTSANNATLRDTNAVIIGASNLNGTLSITAGNAITQSGAITAPTLIAKTQVNGGAAITLNNSGNTPTSIDLRSRNAADTANAAGALTYTGTAGFDVAAANTTGTVTLTAGGALTQSGAMTGSTLTLSTSGDITLNNAANAFTTLAVTSGNNVTFQDSNALVLGTSTIAGNFSLTTGGALTQSGAVVVNGSGATTTLDVGAANNITLNNANNDFTNLAITAGNTVSITDVNALNMETSTISGNLSLTAGNSLTQSGALTISGTPTFTLTTPNTDILLASAANIFDAAPVITNNGNVRDLALRNASANATLSTLPGGLRNLTLYFDAAAMPLPTVSISGNLSATAPTLTINGAISSSGGSISFVSLAARGSVATDIVFNASVTALNGALTLSNLNNVINNASLLAASFQQSSGNLTAFGSNGGLTTTGNASITGYNVTGTVNVGSLTLNTSFANLFGTVGGQSGYSAINRIVLLNSIRPQTHFFDGIDMVIPSIPIASIFPNYYTYPNVIQSPYELQLSPEDLQLLALLDTNQNCVSLGSGIYICSKMPE